MSGKRFSEEDKQFIRDNYLKYPLKRIAKMIGASGCGVNGVMKREGLLVPKDVIEARKKETQFKKGDVSHNKGKKIEEWMSETQIAKSKMYRFKKGSVPHNLKYNGHERITKDGYVEIRIKHGVYRLKHLHNWELLNGPLPEGYCLRSVDENRQNCEPENWKLITRAENIRMNTIHRYPEDLKKSIRLVKKLTRTLNQNTKL